MQISYLLFNLNNEKELADKYGASYVQVLNLLEDVNYSNINFQAKTLKLKKPVLENPEMQKLSDKISTFLEKMPQNFNIKKPVQIKAGENLIGFTIDRTEEDKTKLIIKLKK